MKNQAKLGPSKNNFSNEILDFTSNIIPNKNASLKFTKGQGPLSDIILNPEHGGPILCLDASNDIIITGSTDHGIRVYNIQTGKQIKELFSKNFGHTEWVTCVKILKNKKIISGGMDSNICVWEPTGVSCKYITENTGSISKILLNENEKILLSASYDSSVRLFDLGNLQCLSTLSGVHKGPVSEVEWKNSLCVSGSKDGSVAIWDLNQEKCVKHLKLHGGLVKNIKFFCGNQENNNSDFDNLIVTAGSNDGMINCIDMRSNNPIFSKQIHRGSLNFLAISNDNKIISGSSDKTIRILDITNNFNEITCLKTTDSVVCGDIYENFLALGCADGNMLGYDLNSLECLYGYGCDNKGSLNCIKIMPDLCRIITAGDCAQGMQLIF